jgi:hypothetical protein
MTTPADEPAGDYSYDLAHEDVPGGTPAASDPAARPDQVHVTTDAPDEGGDYSYDLAHEVPPGAQ